MDMKEIASRLGWFFAVALVISYTTYLVATSVVNAQASGKNEPVVVRDDIQLNAHYLSGMVLVPSPCDQLAVSTNKIGLSTFELQFTTWREPSVTCNEDPTPRAFRTIAFGPSAGIAFVATLDGIGLPIAVVQLKDVPGN